MLIDNFGPTSDLRFSSDDRHLIVAGGWTRKESVVQVMDIDQNQSLVSLSQNEWTSKAAFNPINDNVIAAGYAHSIDLWDIKQNSKLFTVEQDFPISSSGALVLPIGVLGFSGDGAELASMSTEGYVWLWDTNSGERKQFFQDDSIVQDTTQTLHSPSDCELIFNPTNDLLITTNNDQIRIWNVSNGDLIRTINEEVTNLAFNGEGTLLAMSDDAGIVTLWGVS